MQRKSGSETPAYILTSRSRQPVKVIRPGKAGIKLIIGLGNPGPTYQNTYHNIGLWLINYLANQKSLSRKWQKPKSKKFEFLKTKPYVLVRSLTFMNESGRAALAALNYLKSSPQKILVIHDDSDLEISRYKLSFGRGSAGHKGIESIIKHLKTKDFWRLRIGIRPPPKKGRGSTKRLKAGEFVLQKITLSDQRIFQSVFEEIAEKLIENENPSILD